MTAVAPAISASNPDPEGKGYGGPVQIQNAFRRLAGGAEAAAKALIDIAENSESDLARVQASQAILNRVGLQTSTDLNIRVLPSEYDQAGPTDSHTSPAEVIQQRLLQLRASAEEPVVDEDGIVDAVLVTEEDQR